MIKRIILSITAFFIIVLTVVWLFPLDEYFPGIFSGGKSVLIVYDEPEPNHVEEDTADALSLRQLMGHFKPYNVEMVSTGEYKKGQAKKFDIVVYVGLKPQMPIPSYFLDDIYFGNKTIVWIGANLDQMANRHSLDKYGFKPVDASDQHASNRVEYKGKSLWKMDTSTYAVEITNPNVNKVYAWATTSADAMAPAGHSSYGAEVEHAGAEVPAPEPASTDSPLEPLPANLNFDVEALPLPGPRPHPPVQPGSGERLPWIVAGDNFWYVASNPISYNVEGGAYLAFCDILHEVFHSKVEEDHPGFVRIEDVHAKRNGQDLIAAADYLKSKNIPFAFTLVPVYINPATNEHIYLSNDQDFLAVVQGLIARGGVPILHGYTHQYEAETAVDYEFWSGPTGRPVATGPEYASERIIRSLSECYLADVYPLAWTTPHYAAGQVDYQAIRNYFTTVVERRQPIDRLGSDQFFPYIIYSDMHQQIIIPENLGYVQPDAGRDAKAILKDADNSLVVRDGWGSFFFHTFLDVQLLKDITEGMEKLGYHWVSLTDYNNKVRTEDTTIISGVGEIKINLKSQYLHKFSIDEKGKRKGETFSFRPVTGNIERYVTSRPREISVHQGVYTSPPMTVANITKFRPVISGITSPVAVFLLFVGLMIMFTFLVIWIFLLIRKASQEMRSQMARKR